MDTPDVPLAEQYRLANLMADYLLAERPREFAARVLEERGTVRRLHPCWLAAHRDNIHKAIVRG